MTKRIELLFGILLAIVILISAQAKDVEAFGDVGIHGFLSQGYLDATKGNDYLSEGTGSGTFEFNEMGINFTTEVIEDLAVGIQFFAFDLGDLGNDEVVLDWGFAAYKFNDYIGLRAGVIKIPHGFYNETRDIDLARTPIFLPSSVYGEMFRDAFTRLKGAGLFGQLPLGFSYDLIFGVVGIAADGGLVSGYENLLNRIGLAIDDTSMDKAYAVNLQWTAPFPGFRAGASFYEVIDFELNGTSSALGGVPIHIKNKDFGAMVVSMEFFLDKLRLVAEYTQDYLYFHVNAITDNAILLAAFPNGRVTTVDNVLEGYYGAITYRLFQWLELETYYSEFYLDKDDKSGRETYGNPANGKPVYQAYLKDLCFSARFDINYNWIAKLELHYMKGSWTVISGDDPFGVEKYWNLYAAKITYSF